jgi:hypothetical protein
MVVGILHLRIFIPDAHSLKEKRHVVRGLRDRIRHRFNVSVAEVDSLDRWQEAVLGVAVATNDPRLADRILAKVVTLARTAPGAIVTRYETEIL